MVLYKCEKCNKDFHLKGDYTRHTKRKFPCSKKTPGVLQKTGKKSNDGYELKNTCTRGSPETTKSKYECKYCNSKFTRKYSLNRHIKDRCKMKKEEDEAMEGLLVEIKEMKKQLELLKSEKAQTINNITTNNNLNNNLIKNDISIIAFGKEDLSRITKNTMINILSRGFKSLPLLFENIHFNDNYPEYHNIYSSNLNSKHICIYDGEHWKKVDKADTLDNILNQCEDIIGRRYKDYKDELGETARRKLERFLGSCCEKETLDAYKEQLTLLMYNKKYKIDNLRKKIDN